MQGRLILGSATLDVTLQPLSCETFQRQHASAACLATLLLVARWT